MLVHTFGAKDPLEKIHTPQGQYLRCYLADLGARTVIEEPSYFDRDYLHEFAAFYSGVATPLANFCRRLHFFDVPINGALLRAALEGPGDARTSLEGAYLGFAVIRPLPHAPLGRTVVKWYPDSPERYPGRPRNITPARWYRAHLAGMPLQVLGLAWQQQDGSVARCATIGLWCALNSSAFDDHHAVPTTAEVTRYAYESLRHGGHIFPASDGLDVRQMLEAIARARLTPVLLAGDAADGGFRIEKFATACAVMIRSGYPVLISGRLKEGGGHVICATGFREAAPSTKALPKVAFQDGEVDCLYVHDDNLGPNVRMRVRERRGKVVLQVEPPPKRYPGPRLPDPTESYPEFTPEDLIVAVHEGLHVTADELHRIAMRIGANIGLWLTRPSALPITTTAQFSRIAHYLKETLAAPFGAATTRSPEVGTLRLSIAERLPPMSLFVGVVRLGYGSAPIADVLIDTSDRPSLEMASTDASAPPWRAFGTVLYQERFRNSFVALRNAGIPVGPVVSATEPVESVEPE